MGQRRLKIRSGRACPAPWKILSIAASLAITGAASLFAPPVPTARADEPAEKSRSLQDSCIHLSQVRRTVILDDQTVLFHMTGGRIKKVSLAFPCPSLKFYGSFAYEAYSNRLCARVDTIVSRAGTHCPIGDISTVTPPAAAGNKNENGNDGGNASAPRAKAR